MCAENKFHHVFFLLKGSLRKGRFLTIFKYILGIKMDTLYITEIKKIITDAYSLPHARSKITIHKANTQNEKKALEPCYAHP